MIEKQNYQIKNTKNLSQSDIDSIKQQTTECFKYPIYLPGERYFCIYRDGKIIASLCYVNDEYIANVCTKRSERRKGHQRKLFDYTVNWIHNVAMKPYTYLYTENDSRGDLPRKIYRKMGWYLGERESSRTVMYHFPFHAQSKIPIELPWTTCAYEIENSTSWLAALLSSVFKQTLSFVGCSNFRKINTDFLIQNKNSPIITNHLFIIEDSRDELILEQIKQKIIASSNDRFFMCAVSPNNNVQLIQKPCVYPGRLVYQHQF